MHDIEEKIWQTTPERAQSKEQSYSTDVRNLLRVLGLWLFFEMLYYLVPGLKLQLTFDALRYLAIVFVPLSVLLTIHKFLFGKKLDPKIHAAMLIFPIASLFMAYTNDSHHLFFAQRYIEYEHGLYYVHTFYGMFYK
ncbi:hypothetical protein ADUPG1_002595, partial [Aduncisulcus paluster]